MATLSFYARGDGSAANNAALNVENLGSQPTVLITFDSGATGDLVLEYNGGAVDPDTKVVINGTIYNFKVELTGGLPFGSPKVPDALEGKQVAVISVVIAGKTERFFFVTDGSGTMTLMAAFGNGAIALSNADFAPPPVYICFCGGTTILTPKGYRKVEHLRIGDIVLNGDGAAKPILWVGRTEVSRLEMLRSPERRPVCIVADALEPGVPFADLYVSAQHRLVLESAFAELLIAEPRVLVSAKYFLGSIARRVMPTTDVDYYHILLEHHDTVVSNGLVSESLQLSLRAFNGLSRDAQISLSMALPIDTMQKLFRQTGSLPSLKQHEARVLLDFMFGPGACQSTRNTDQRSASKIDPTDSEVSEDLMDFLTARAV